MLLDRRFEHRETIFNRVQKGGVRGEKFDLQVWAFRLESIMDRRIVHNQDGRFIFQDDFQLENEVPEHLLGH